MSISKSIEPLFNEANSAVNTFSQSSARATNNAADLVQRLKEGSIDVETFDQRFKAVESSLAKGNLEFAAAEESITKFRDAVQALPEGAIRNQGLELVAAFEEGLFRSSENLQVNKELLEVLKSQRDELIAQAELSSFIKDLTKDAKGIDDLSMQLGLFTAGLPDEATLSAQIAFLNGLVTANQSQIEAYDSLTASLNSLTLTEADRLSILGAQKGQEQELVNTLNTRGNVEAKLIDGQIELRERTQEATGAVTEQGTAIKEFITSSEKITISLGELGSEAVESTKQAVDAMETLVESAISELPNLIDSAIKDFRKLTRELNSETAAIRDFEIPQLEIEARLDRNQFNLDMAKLQGEQFITQLELDLDINKLKQELGDITPERAIEEEGRIQQEILDKREELLNAEIAASIFQYEDNLSLLKLENTQNIAAIEAKAQQLTDETNAQVLYITNLISAYESILNNQTQVNNANLQNTVSAYNSIALGLYQNLVNGGVILNTAIRNAFEKAGPTGGPGFISINAPDFQEAELNFSAALDSLGSAQNSVLSSIEENKQAAIDAENSRFENASDNLDRQFTLEQQGFINRGKNLEKERQLESLNSRKRIKDLEDERAKGGKGSDEAKKKLEEAQKTLDKFVEDVLKGFKQIQKLVTDFVSIVFEGFINSQQLEVDAAKLGETLSGNLLTATTARLNSVQEELNASLSEETSLKEELVTLSERLNESQLSYLQAITEGDLASASEEYVATILEQSKKTVELNRAIRDRAILEGAAKTLEQQQQSAQEAARLATQERIEAERELAELQQTTSGILEVLTYDFSRFNSALKDLGPALSVLTGKVSGDIPGLTADPLKELGKSFQKTIGEVLDAQKLLEGGGPTSQTASKVVEGASKVGASVGNAAETAGAQVANSFIGKALSGLSGAISGAGIGSAIGQVLGDDTYASTIGGAVGGVVSAVWGPAISGAITSGLGLAAGGVAASIVGSIATFGIPLIGALLFGGLFGGPKKPSARVRGTAGSEGFEVADIERRDGLSQSAANQLGDFVGQVYDSIFTSLERANIEFADSVDVFVRNSEGEFGRITTTFENGLELTGADLGDSAEAAGEELIRQFLGGLTITRDEAGLVTFRSLVVDALTPNAENLQQALDVFAELEDVSKKTQERFNAAIEFATNFDNAVSELAGTAPTLENALDLITRAAESNASSLLMQYREFQSQTEEFFGVGSVQADRAAEALRSNALAQIGLVETTDGAIISLKDYESELTAGRLAIEKTIQDFKAFESVLLELGFSAEQASALIDQGIDIALTSQVEDFASNISRALSSLKDPTQSAVFEIAEIGKASSDLVREAQGILDGVIAQQSQGLDVAQDVEIAEQALSDARELGTLRVAEALKELSSAQLRAIISSDNLADAETKRLAAQRLVVQQQIEAFDTIKKVSSSFKDFNSRLEDLTGIISAPMLNEGFASLSDVMTILGETDLTGFSAGLTSAVNGISSSSNVFTSYTGSINKLNDAMATGNLGTQEYIDLLILFSDAAISAAESQKEVIEAYQSAADDLRQLFNSTLSSVQDAISGMRDQLVGLVDAISESSNSILNIYDDTLADLAGSGNELFDLRDSAREAFAASAEAVKQFEEANSLSGKSSAQIRQEIESIQTTIDSLLSGENISFQEFRELSQLTAVQSALERELSSIIGVESEYENLISAREQAAKDLAFAEATILELGDNLIDTRRTESEIIQQVQDATVSFIEAQKDLEDITKLLAENNFDLNQAREDENDRVLQVSSALKKLERDMKSLESVISSILGDPQLLEQIRQSAISVGELIARNLGFEEGSVEWDAVVSENLNAAVNAFEQGIVPIANTLNRILGFDIQNLTGVNYELDTLSVTSQSLTSKFKQFNSDLVKYLDSEGLAEFYGSGGIFAKFRDSLVNTIAVNGFDVLTAAGGPLEGFELSAGSIESALISLATTSSGTVVTLESIEDTISSISSSIGTDTTGLTGSIDGLFNTLSSDIQEFNSSVSEIELIDFSAIGIELRSAFDELISVFAIDNTDNVSALKTSLTDLNAVIDGLAKTGIDPITTIPESIDILVNNILNLENAIDGFTAGGGIQAFISSVEQLAQAIADAFARINLEGDVPVIEGIDYTSRINRDYLNVLGRRADQPGLEFYQGVLEQDPQFDLISELERSIEATRIIPAFQAVLDRLPNLDEINTYISEFERNTNYDLESVLRGTTGGTTDVTTGGTTGGTTVGTTGGTAGPSDTDISLRIRRAYVDVLERGWDSAGYNYYFDYMRSYDRNFNIENELRNSIEYEVLQAFKRVKGFVPTLEQRLPLIDTLDRIPSFDLEGYISRNYASGGYVYGPGTSTSDSVSANLSRGEYVVQASAVEKLGINALNALNATGDMMSMYRANSDFSLNRAPINIGQNAQQSDSIANGNSDTNIEVNVINNGTAQQPTSEPVVRRENGKIVVDVILEDIRNNGPIKRTIRSIR